MKTHLKRIWHRLTADKRQFGLFCSLCFVALLLWARIIVIERPPKTAVANPVTESVVEEYQSSDQRKVYVSLDSEVLRNPFLVHQAAFPMTGAMTNNIAPQSSDNGQEAYTHSLEGFELEAVMGEIAMINGRVCRVGDVLAGASSYAPLTITSIGGRSVIISAGKNRYELTITP
ncbi:MAG: hypothetical protein CMJ38_01750 [Phycisphaerae bacterium]|nr:hypothetical protein [Phycisphaerae bacterium]|tara:strand:+ start:198 stop:719 length:522 start_codon:yes stop_codon:yes gene_type:complete